jgi:hypothetical protein
MTRVLVPSWGILALIVLGLLVNAASAQRAPEGRACAELVQGSDPAAMIADLLEQAACHEDNGRLASAWYGYRHAEEIALREGDSRASDAGERARALEPRLDRLVLELDSNAQPRGLQVTRNGEVVDRALWDTAIAVDAGRTRIEAMAPGHVPWAQDVTVRGEGRRVVVQIPPLAVMQTADSLLPASTTPAPSNTQRIVAITVGSLGLVGLGIGAYFGLSAKSSFDDSSPLCNHDDVCERRGVELREDAHDAALAATVSATAGAAAVIGALVLWLTAETSSEQARTSASIGLSVDPARYRLQLVGRF